MRSAVSRPRTGARTVSAGVAGGEPGAVGAARRAPRSRPRRAPRRARPAPPAPRRAPRAPARANAPTATASAGTVAAVVTSGPVAQVLGQRGRDDATQVLDRSGGPTIIARLIAVTRPRRLIGPPPTAHAPVGVEPRPARLASLPDVVALREVGAHVAAAALGPRPGRGEHGLASTVRAASSTPARSVTGAGRERRLHARRTRRRARRRRGRSRRPRVIARWTRPAAPTARSARTATAARAAGSGGRSRRDRRAPPARPRTRPSSRLLDASRFAPCRPVRADLAGRVQPGHGGPPVQVGDDPAARVVRRRASPGSARGPGRCRRRGTPRTRSGSAPANPSSARASRNTWSVPVSAIRRVIAAGDDVARGEVGERVHAGHERPPGLVEQHRTLAAHGLGDQRRLPVRRTVEQHRRVELHELEVRRRRPGAQREREPVAGGRLGVGRRRVQLPEAAGGEQHRRRAQRTGAARGRRAARRRPPGRRSSSSASTATCPVSEHEPRRAAATSARSTSAPVASPPACTTRTRVWPPSRARAGRPCAGRCRTRAPRCAQPRDRGRPVGQDRRDGGGVAQPGAGGEGVA